MFFIRTHILDFKFEILDCLENAPTLTYNMLPVIKINSYQNIMECVIAFLMYVLINFQPKGISPSRPNTPD